MIKNFNYLISAGNARNGSVRQGADSIAQAVNNFFQCGENLVTESALSDIFPYLFNGIHLGRLRRDVVTGYTGTYPFLTPAVFWLVNSTKSSFILEHQANFLPAVDNFQFFYGVVNCFEAAISSSLAFLGCLPRGMILRHP